MGYISSGKSLDVNYSVGGTITIDEESLVFNCTSPYDVDIQLSGTSKFLYDSSADTIIISTANIDLNSSGNLDIIGDFTAATLTMTGFSIDADGDMVVKSIDVNSGGITEAGAISGATSIACTSQAITLAATGKLALDARTTAHTDTTGVIDLDVDAAADSVCCLRISGDAKAYNAVMGIRVDMITGALASGESTAGLATYIDATGALSGSDIYCFYASLSADAQQTTTAFMVGSTGFDYALQCRAASIVGDVASGGDLLLISTTHATKGDIQFHDTSYYITSAGALTVGAITGTSIACTSEAITLAATGKLAIDATTTDHTDTAGVIDLDVDAGAINVKGIHLTFNANTYDGTDGILIKTISGALASGGDVSGIESEIDASDSLSGSTISAFNAYTSGTAGSGEKTAFFVSGGLFNYALFCNDTPIVGSSAASGDLLLVSTTHATKGDIQFHSTSYYITSAGALTVGAITGTTITNAGLISNTAGAAEALRLSTNVDDYTKFTLDANGGLAIQSVDAAASAANISITADGTFAVTSTGFNLSGAGAVSGVTTLAMGGALSGATTIDGSGDLTMGTITMTGFSVDADGDTTVKSLITAGTVDGVDVSDHVASVTDPHTTATIYGSKTLGLSDGNLAVLPVGTSGQVLKRGTSVWEAGTIAGGAGNRTISPASAVRQTANGPEAFQKDGTNQSWVELRYDDTTDEKAYWHFIAPDNLSSSADVVLKLTWIPTSTASGNVFWEIGTGTAAEGATWNATLATAAIADASGQNSANTNECTISAGRWTASRPIILKIMRDADSASDTLVGDASLVMVEYQYTKV